MDGGKIGSLTKREMLYNEQVFPFHPSKLMWSDPPTKKPISTHHSVGGPRHISFDGWNVDTCPVYSIYLTKMVSMNLSTI